MQQQLAQLSKNGSRAATVMDYIRLLAAVPFSVRDGTLTKQKVTLA